MSDTPRVDAMCESRSEPLCGLIWADRARELERELAAVTAERDKTKEDADHYRAHYEAACANWNEVIIQRDEAIALAQADKERLDWLDSLPDDTEFTPSGADIRSAIDAARK